MQLNIYKHRRCVLQYGKVGMSGKVLGVTCGTDANSISSRDSRFQTFIALG